MFNLQTGNFGEDLACRYLEKSGYKIIARNFRIRGGEIDIIARDHDFLVFVEVKTRNSLKFGLPIEALTPWKIKALLKTALFYLQNISWNDKPYRLDAVCIDLTSEEPEIELIKNIT